MQHTGDQPAHAPAIKAEDGVHLVPVLSQLQVFARDHTPGGMAIGCRSSRRGTWGKRLPPACRGRLAVPGAAGGQALQHGGRRL